MQVSPVESSAPASGPLAGLKVLELGQLIAGPFAPELMAAGTKAGNAFRQAFGRQMEHARTESTHHGRNIASG